MIDFGTIVFENGDEYIEYDEGCITKVDEYGFE